MGTKVGSTMVGSSGRLKVGMFEGEVVGVSAVGDEIDGTLVLGITLGDLLGAFDGSLDGEIDGWRLN